MHNNLQDKTDCVLGIDTSNYKTSVAVIDSAGNIVCDHRQLLKVKQGERGLRQSDALFQHVMNLPGLVKKCFSEMDPARIRAVACSDKPRPVEGSYMPVFNAGIGMAESIAATLKVPCYKFSHQEGHIEAIRFRTAMECEPELLCYHLSGGTCELLKVTGEGIDIIGGSKDISFGQVIDRVGVKLGMPFPAGEYMDKAALNADTSSKHLKKINTDGLFFNLSGIETQAGRKADELMTNGSDPSELIRETMDKLADLLIRVTENACESTSINKVIFTGGVSSSKYISGILNSHFDKKDIIIEFGDQNLSQDNAVGIALLGGKKLWR
jgi:N6-L-threonylcarbamoyladenine synthase